jgi:RHS repeat-associated protein
MDFGRTRLYCRRTGIYSKERDAETGLDYFIARYYSGSLGRFMSPDLPLLDQNPGDPQSWNLYTYVRNNPLSWTDPDGYFAQECSSAKVEQLDDFTIVVTAGISEEDCGLSRINEETGPGGIPLDFWMRSLEQLQTGVNNVFDEGKLALHAENNLRQGNYFAYGIDQIGLAFIPRTGAEIGLALAFPGRRIGNIIRVGRPAIKASAAKLGFIKRIPPQKAPFDSHGQPVFFNGKRYITPDVHSHIGGVWKMFDRQGNRLGTFDANLKKIGK